ELLVMDVALDVELGVVALAQRGGRLLEVGEALPQVVDLDVDLRVEDGRVLDGDLEGVVALDLDLGPDLDDGVELDVALLLPGGDLELGRGDRVEILGLDGLQVVVGHGVSRTGSDSKPRMASPGLRTGSPAGSTPENRSTSPRNTSCPSIRASRAPRQKWRPQAKARWRLSGRPTSKRSGSAKRAGSRLAAARSVITTSPFRSRCPSTSRSSR